MGEGKADRLPDLAAELIGLKVEVIVAIRQAAVAAKQATSTIPIVFLTPANPVGTGLVASLARPDGNLTGLTFFAPELNGKRLELLKEAIPGVSRVGCLWNPAQAGMAQEFGEAKVAAQTLGLELQSLEVRDPNQFESAFEAANSERADALIVIADPFLARYQTQIVNLAAKSRLPQIYKPERIC